MESKEPALKKMGRGGTKKRLPKPRKELRSFGSFLKRVRDDVAQLKTQREAARALDLVARSSAKREDSPSDSKSKKINSLSESLVGLLESGRISNPDLSFLRLLADTYSRDWSIQRERRGSGLNAPMVRDQSAILDQLIAELVRDKYSISELKVSLLKADIQDLDGLADWEDRTAEKDLWIASPVVVDDQHPRIAEAVKSLLKKGCNITYLLDRGQTEAGKPFWKFLQRLASSPEMKEASGSIFFFPLTPKELQWMAASFVITNPHTIIQQDTEGPPAEGFTVVSLEGSQPYGIRMSKATLEDRALFLNVYIQENKDSQTIGFRNEQRDSN